MVLRFFQNSPPLERWACFYGTISGNVERFQYFDLETDSKRIIFVISKTNGKTNRMVSTKCVYHKERSFASNYFIFFEDFVSI